MFSNPGSIAVSVEGCVEYVYVADTGNNRIQKFTSDGEWTATWGGFTAEAVPFRFNNPQGIKADLQGKYIYIADTGNSKVLKFNTRGSLVGSFGGYGTADGKFRYPRDVAVDSSGRIYVADNMNYRIQRLSPEGVFEMKWGKQGESDGQFNDHYGVAVDAENNIYVADSGNNRVQVFDSNGAWARTIGSVEQGIHESEFYYPMAVDVCYEKAVNPDCIPKDTDTQTFTETPTDTATETFTETPADTATETFTETPTDTATETFTETPTDTATETFTETPTDTATETFTETPTDTATETFTETPTDTATETYTETPVLTSVTPVVPPIPEASATFAATPAVTAAACSLCYSVELGNKSKKTCDMPAIAVRNHHEENENGKHGEKISVIKAEGAGYIYVYKEAGLKISVYDEQACYLEKVMEMISCRKDKSSQEFAAWFVKDVLRKNAENRPPEYYIAMLFPVGISSMEWTKDRERFEEMDGSNTYNFPNPCKGRTSIRFSLAKQGMVNIIISEVSGRRVWEKKLMHGETIPGINYMEWDCRDSRGTDAPNGTYIMRVISGDKTVIKKISIVR
jgi:DNA-binding beta-propeller fold protein YncE